ncbi:MAG: hypothetical protein EOO99_05345 [Pedobacter sp.]|nr:MAG: hypothetical protein EOO99_05345 [Pedobacter sp.]
MQRKLIIFFIATFLISTTEIGHFLKIPLIFTHFQTHKERNKDISFVGFLALHYLDEYSDGIPDEVDKTLPFKVCNESVFQLTWIAQTEPIRLDIDKGILPLVLKHRLSLHKILFQSSYLDSIWQPPRLV